MTLGGAEPPHPRQQCREMKGLPQLSRTVGNLLLGTTCISLEVLGGDHDHEPNGPLISEHLIGPPADGAHALHSSNAIVGNEDLGGGQGQGVSGWNLSSLLSDPGKGVQGKTFSMTRLPPKRVTNSACEATVKSRCRSIFLCSRPFFARCEPDMLGLQ